jgi:sulfide:quinone oxidoreductase
MLESSELEAGLGVSGQITADDMRDLVAQGVRTIINNRPDGEDLAQLPSEQVARLAHELGLTYYHLPVTLEAITADDGKAFAAIVDAADGSIHAYCRSGARASNLWILGCLISGKSTEAQAQAWGAARRIDIGAALRAFKQVGSTR